jgi:uracil-DNA glycosylase
MSERLEEYKDYRLRVKACHDCGEDVIHKGHVKSVPGYYHPDRCDVLVVTYLPDEIDYTRTQVKLLTGEQGKVIGYAMEREKIAGHRRVGFTSLIKCKLTNGRVKRRVCKACMAKFYDHEISSLKPKVIVLAGIDVIKVVLPEVLAASPHNNMYSLEGRPFLYFDQWYMFMRDPHDCMTGKSFKQGVHTGEVLLIGDAIRKAVDM